MSTRLTHCAIATGHLEGGDFAPAGQQGDSSTFTGNFADVKLFAAPPRVIVTPISEDSVDVGALPVCVLKEASTTGFTVAARNSSDHHGFAAFDWFAILETPGVAQDVPDVHCGALPPVFLAPASTPGSRGGTASLDQLNTESATVVLTSTDQGISGHSVAGVGGLQTSFVVGAGNTTRLIANNSDCSGGSCAFNWAALNPRGPGSGGQLDPELTVVTGRVAAAFFQSSCRPGDWHTWDIQFDDPFGTTPVVLVMATNSGLRSTETNPAVVGVVQAATPRGFRLAARNSDLTAGEAGFDWIALGTPSTAEAGEPR